MRRSTAFILVLTMAAFLFAGCATTREVKRIDPGKITDLSGHWNDTDSQQVAQTVVTDCLAQGWLPEWKENKGGKKPIVIIGKITNKSHEHINVQTFVKDMQSSLINSRKVRFVSSRTERGELREERKDQHSGYTSEGTRAGVGQEMGANFMMKGSINTILDELGGKRAVWYQVNMELHDLTTNEVVWIGQHKIKKLITKGNHKW